MADRIGVMRAGRMVQVGSPREIFETPANRFVAEFMGVANLWNGVVHADGLTMDLSETGTIRLATAVPPGAAVRLGVRAERMRHRCGLRRDEPNVWRRGTQHLRRRYDHAFDPHGAGLVGAGNRTRALRREPGWTRHFIVSAVRLHGLPPATPARAVSLLLSWTWLLLFSIVPLPASFC